MAKNLPVFCLAVLCAITFLNLHGAFSKVLELDDRFSGVAKKGYWLVMFYAPWCGHCKKLEPTWLQLGVTLAKQQPDVNVARLDATKYNALAGQYKIKGFPTIKFFKDGQSFDYNGQRNVPSIISFVNRAKRPAVTQLEDNHSFQIAQRSHDVFFLYVGTNENPLKRKYTQVATLLFTRLSFYSIEITKLPGSIVTRSQNTILVFKDAKYYEIPELFLEGNLMSWMMEEQFPTYNHLTAISFHQLRAAGKPFAIAVLEKGDSFNVTMQGVAYKRTHPYTFCWTEGNELVNSITYGSVSVPNVVVYIDTSRDFYVMNEEEQPKAMTKANVEDFFGKIDKGELQAKGGSSIKEQAKRAMGDFANFFIDLFTNSPVLGVVLILVPSFIVVMCCICICTLSDDGESGSEYDEDEEDSEFEDERPPNPDDIIAEEGHWEQQEVDAPTEGLRQRIKETTKEEDKN